MAISSCSVELKRLKDGRFYWRILELGGPYGASNIASSKRLAGMQLAAALASYGKRKAFHMRTAQ